MALSYAPAVFLDKDGTLVENIPYNSNPELMTLTAKCREGLSLLQTLGYQLVVITNQPGVALGHIRPEALQAVEEKLQTLIQPAKLSGFYYCPHHPEGSVQPFVQSCRCRKPQTGLLEIASVELNLDLSKSWLIGDILDDIEAGRKSGCRTVLITNGNEDQWRIRPSRVPDHLARTILEAAEIIRREDFSV